MKRANYIARLSAIVLMLAGFGLLVARVLISEADITFRTIVVLYYIFAAGLAVAAIKQTKKEYERSKRII